MYTKQYSLNPNSYTILYIVSLPYKAEKYVVINQTITYLGMYISFISHMCRS